MKTIKEMTEREILALENADLELMVKFAMAEAGIKILEKPVEPTYAALPEKKMLGFRISGCDIIFTSYDTANHVSEAILEVASDAHKSNYIPDQNYYDKFLEKTDSSIGLISEETFYSKSVAESIKGVIAENKKLKDAYEILRKEYNNAEDEAKILRDEIYGRYEEVCSKFRSMEDMKRRYDEYLTLANGDNDTAMRFLKKAYTVDKETEEYILTPNQTA